MLRRFKESLLMLSAPYSIESRQLLQYYVLNILAFVLLGIESTQIET